MLTTFPQLLLKHAAERPEAPALRAALKGLADPRVSIELGPYHALRATFDTPHGPRSLT